MPQKRYSRTFSCSDAELNKLDAWAHHHNLSRSEAIRSLIMALRIDGQTALNDFEDVQPMPEAVEAVDVASDALVLEEEPREGQGIVSFASRPVCFERPSDLLEGRCIGAYTKDDLNPDAPACPRCWPEGMTASATRKEARFALARRRADEAAELMKKEDSE
jgi:hypothetical protein